MFKNSKKSPKQATDSIQNSCGETKSPWLRAIRTPNHLAKCNCEAKLTRAKTDFKLTEHS